MLNGEMQTFQFTEAERSIFAAPARNIDGSPVLMSQWAPRFRYVEGGSMRGPWSNDTTPYLVLPMDKLCDPWVRLVVLMWAPQTGKTQLAFNALCFWADTAPGPALYVMPDENTAKKVSRKRLLPMFRNTPKTGKLLGGRREDTTGLSIVFKNGMDLGIAWAGSPSALASDAKQYVVFDETDKYPDFAGKEADPISLGEQRQNTFPYSSKQIRISTPSTPDGNINKSMENDVDEVWYYQAKCPYCGTYQVMKFENIKFPKEQRDPRIIMRKKLAWYECVECHWSWDDHKRDQAVLAGRWHCDDPVDRPRAVGFHLPSWYSRFVSLSRVVADFIKGLEDPRKMMVWVTQHAAEPWVDIVESKKDEEILENKTELEPGVVPGQAVALSAGIDVQKHGFWFVVRAWDADLNSWLVQYGKMSSFADVEALVFNTTWPVEDSQERMGIFRAAIDTGGGESSDGDWSRTEEIYGFLRAHAGRNRIFGIKGASRPQLKRVVPKVIDRMSNGKKLPGGIELRFLDTHAFKDLVHWRLGLTGDDDQQFFLHAETGMDYALQVTAEQKIKDKRGKVIWKQRRKDNHLFDCEVYAAACVDFEWAPSFQLMAKTLELSKPQEEKKKAGSTDTNPESGRVKFARPSWLDR